MTDSIGLDRRAFLRGAGMTAVAGAATAAGSLAANAGETGPRPMKGSKYDLDEIYDRYGTDSVKWDRQVERWGKEQFDIGMGIADMDFRTAPAVKDAIIERAQHENWGYLSSTESLREAISMWNSSRHGYELDPESIVITTGVHPGLIAALNTVAQPATKVIMTTPTYNGFYGDLRWSRTLANDSEMYKDDDGVYHIDWDDFESRLTPDTRAFLLCNPQNPTGNCWSEEDLLRMGELCLKNGVTVLADEIHCDFVMKGQKYTPFASLPDKDIVNNSLTFKAISKTFSLAGMKNAYFFSTNPVLLERVKYNHRPDINTLGVVANEAAYREGAEWFDQVLAYIDRNHEFVESYIAERIPMLKYKKAEGTYLAWLDVSAPVEALDAASMAEKEDLRSAEHYMEKWFVENAGVQLNPGSTYGTGGAGHMRMNLGAPRPLIEQALDKLNTALQRV